MKKVLPINEIFQTKVKNIENINEKFELEINELKKEKKIDFKSIQFDAVLQEFNLDLAEETISLIKSIANNNNVTDDTIFVFALNNVFNKYLV